MKKLLLITAFIFSLTFAQQLFAGDTLYWNSPLRLTWNDFNGKAGRSPSGTGSYVGLDYELSNDKTSFKTKVYAYFLRNLSWTQTKSSDTLLQYEQLRFDMAELYARKLRKAFSEYKFNEATLVQDIKKIFNDIKEERAAMNLLYDKETKYGKDWVAQQQWATKISTDLDKLSEFIE